MAADPFDYHAALTDAVARAPSGDRDRLVWIMTADFRFDLMRFASRDMGVEVDGSKYFGIPIEVGEPSNGERFELVLRKIH